MNIGNSFIVDVKKLSLFLFCALPFTFDFLYGFLIATLAIDVPVSAIYRFVILLPLIVLLLFSKKKLVKQLVGVMLALFLFSFMFWDINSFDIFFREIKQFIKVLYIFLYIALYFYLDDGVSYYDRILRLFSFIGVFISIIIVLSFVFDVGVSTYGEYSFATKSFFDAQNDIALSLLLILNVQFYLFVYKGEKKHLIFYPVTFLALFFLGNRAGLIGGIGVTAAYIYLLTTKANQVDVSSIKRYFILILVGGSLIVAAKTAIDYLSDYQYMYEKYSSLVSESPRFKLINAAESELEGSSSVELLFGQGTVNFSKGVESYYPSGKQYSYGKFVEQDFYDMVGSYGIVLGGGVVLVHLLFFINSLWRAITGKLLNDYFVLIGCLLFISHAFMAGHAIVSPTVSPIIALYYYLLLKVREQRV
jgi:hypothetical protein